MAQPRALLNMCFDTICKNADLFCDASYQRPLPAKLQVNLMEKTMALLRLLQLHFPIGFKGDELEKMCALINLFLSKQLLQLTLPKCQVTRGVDFIGTCGREYTHYKDEYTHENKTDHHQHKRQNLRRFLRLLDNVVAKAPNLVELQIPCEPQLMADGGVASRILDQVAKLTRLQALDMPQFHCSSQDLTEIARKMPNLSYLQVTICVDAQNKFEALESVEALAQMPHLRHLVFETTPEGELGWMVAACLRRMPLLRRCGRRVDPKKLYEFTENSVVSEFCKVHMDALRQHHGASLQLEEVFFWYRGAETPLSEHVLRMPNLRTLALDFDQWSPKLLPLLQNVTDLCLINAPRSEALQLLAAVGPQLRTLATFKVFDLAPHDVFLECGNLEEAHLLSISTPAAAPPIACSLQLSRLRALTLRQVDSRRPMRYDEGLNSDVVAALLLAAPLLERVYLDRTEFGAAAAEALMAALLAGTALRRMRFVCFGHAPWNRNFKPFEELLLRMRVACPHFGRCLTASDTQQLKLFWHQFFCGDAKQTEFEFSLANILPILIF